MDYKTLKKMLLSSAKLTEENILEILDTWENNPRTYYDFLKNDGASQHLRAYKGINDDEDYHEFALSKSNIVALPVAEKFFISDETIERFIKVINKFSVKDTENPEFYEWPYLTKTCVTRMSISTLLSLMADWRYVFNFEHDEKGELFNYLHRSLGYDLLQDILAANSFNVLGWMNYARKYPQNTFIKRMLMAEHTMGKDTDIEPVGRKFYICYRLDIAKAMQEFEDRSLGNPLKN